MRLSPRGHAEVPPMNVRSSVSLSAPAAEPVSSGRPDLPGRVRARRPPGDAFLPDGLVPTIPGSSPCSVRAWATVSRRVHARPGAVWCRSGARARALVVATAVDASPTAPRGWRRDGASAPRRRTWASSAATTGAGGRAVVRRVEGRARPIGVGDVQFVTALPPVITDAGDRLAQVELEVALDRVERGRPMLHSFTALPAPPASTSVPGRGDLGIGSRTLPGPLRPAPRCSARRRHRAHRKPLVLGSAP